MSHLLESALTDQQRSDCAANDTLLACSAQECFNGFCRARYGVPTVRRHPRSLADAFPDVRRQSFELHVNPPLWKRFALFIRRRFA